MCLMRDRHSLQVQAVLLLLGGREVPQAPPTSLGAPHQNNRVLVRVWYHC